MTFKEWFYDKTKHKFGHFLADEEACEEVWEEAQRNYPYSICDTKMEMTMIEDAMNLNMSKKEAEEFVNNFGANIIDHMWNEYSNRMAQIVKEEKLKG